MSIALLTGVAAKEVVISTMGVLYQANDDENTVNLQQKLKNDKFETGKNKGEIVFTTPTALAFLIFILIYFPCIGVVVAIKNEYGTIFFGLAPLFYRSSISHRYR